MKLRDFAAFLAGVALVGLISCGGKGTIASRDSDTDEDQGDAKANVTRNVKPAADSEVAVIQTDYGRIVIELYPNVAPKMVERFKQLIKEGFYNGTTFHRVDPALGIIQGGDPLSKGDDQTNAGQGSSPYPNLTAEFSDIPYDRGIVGAARAASNDSANCQFFITLKRQPAFDERYTVFGKVIEGMNTADVIAGAPTDAGTERPSDKIVIKSITLEPRAKFTAFGVRPRRRFSFGVRRLDAAFSTRISSHLRCLACLS